MSSSVPEELALEEAAQRVLGWVSPICTQEHPHFAIRSRLRRPRGPGTGAAFVSLSHDLQVMSRGRNLGSWVRWLGRGSHHPPSLGTESP